MNDNDMCPNCSRYLQPFIPDGYEDCVEGYCPNVDCEYATVYDWRFLQAIKRYRYDDRYDAKQWGFYFEGNVLYEKKKIPEFKVTTFDQKPKVNDINQFKLDTRDLQEIKKPSIYTLKLDNIIGYEGIKRVLRSIVNHKGKKKIHGLIAGAAGTAKTVFLKEMESELVPQGCSFHYIDAATLTKRGLADYIFENDNIEVLTIDEIDKVKVEHQAVFLNMLESGILQTTSFNNIRKKEVKQMTVIATANYLEKLIEPIRTRFWTMYVRAYTKDQYLHIAEKMLVKKYPYITPQVAKYIAVQSYEKIKPPTMRNADRIGNYIRENPSIIKVEEAINDLVSYTIPDDVLKKLDKQT